jgi:acyl carrier protein
MPKQQILADVVVALIAETAPTSTAVTDRDRPLAEQGLDSLDHSALLLAIEERYGIKIPDTAVDGLDTVNRIAAYVAERTSAPGAT